MDGPPGLPGPQVGHLVFIYNYTIHIYIIVGFIILHTINYTIYSFVSEKENFD